MMAADIKDLQERVEIAGLNLFSGKPTSPEDMAGMLAAMVSAMVFTYEGEERVRLIVAFNAGMLKGMQTVRDADQFPSVRLQ